jgi:hypothetical protein
MLLASVIAGLAWETFGSAFTFYAGAVFAALAAVGLGLRPAPRMSEPRQHRRRHFRYIGRASRGRSSRAPAPDRAKGPTP